MSWQKYLLLPRLIWHGVRAPRGGAVAAWNRYWSSVQRTGDGGEVLWDAASQSEFEAALRRMLPHMDRALPIVDMGCGNGRQTRALSAHFPKALGVDMSTQAIAKAQDESRAVANVSYRVIDASVSGAGRQLSDEIGEANVYVRGILHVLDHRSRLGFVQNLWDMIGERGVLYLVETAFQGSALDYLEFLGSTGKGFPEPVQKLIASGLDPPVHFDERQYRKYFSADAWETLTSGATVIDCVPRRDEREMQQIPGFFALARRRVGGGASGPPGAALGRWAGG